jgi:hypothetical protein
VNQLVTRIGPNAKAVFSADGVYRYLLEWWYCPNCDLFSSRELLPFVMLNPSTANELRLDPTLTRCLGFARSFGYAGIAVANLFALISTDPTVLTPHPDPVGHYNDAFIRGALQRSPAVAGWGAAGAALVARRRAAYVAAFASSWLCLGTNRDGSPRHPLYLPSETNLVPWAPNTVKRRDHVRD